MGQNDERKKRRLVQKVEDKKRWQG
jgi:hypothetical protein